MRMGLREANQHFSNAIKAVKAGHEVVLTERGKPIAVIRPLAPAGQRERDLQRLMAAGLVRTVAKPGPMRMRTFRPIRLKGEPLSVTLRRERDER